MLAKNVRAFRLLRQLEQTEVAERMSYFRHRWVRETVSQTERGRRNVSVDELVSLSLALGATIDQLLDPRGPERREGPNLALVRGATLVPVDKPDEVSAEGVTVVLPAQEVNALVCDHKLRMRPTWVGGQLAEVWLEQIDESDGER
jgi:transcriptional regulator with XRE-family HTH domain